MDMHELGQFVFRWLHLVFGITWIGMLYYFNFVQTEYFKEADKPALIDAKAKLAPRALWWFRWGAMLTFITGVVLLAGMWKVGTLNSIISVAALMGTFMFLNVWLVIWPCQQVVLGMKKGDIAACAARAGLASRTNTLFSAPMAFGMLGSFHLGGYGDMYNLAADGVGNGLWAALGLVVVLELNGLFGKMGPMASVKGVVHLTLALTAVIYGLLFAL